LDCFERLQAKICQMTFITFELFALDAKLDIQPGADAFATRTEIMKAIQGHILGKAVYVCLFHRPQRSGLI
jgi:hypothetical protein